MTDGDQGEGLGEGQRLEQLAFGADHGEDGQEADDGGEHGRQHGAAHLAGRAEDHLQPVSSSGRASSRCLQDVLADDDAHVDHRADGDGDARQGHDVGVDAEHFMAMKHISTASGSKRAISSELRRCITITSTTMIVTRISSTSAVFSVPRVS